MMMKSSLLLASTAATLVSAESVYFSVFSDPDCTVPYGQHSASQAANGRPVVVDNADGCHVLSYTSPLDGHLQTNAFGRFNCEADGVTWTEWPSSSQCGVGNKVIVQKLYANKCVYVRTHFGTTYQKLVNYNSPCSAKYNYGAGAANSASGQQAAGAGSVFGSSSSSKKGEHTHNANGSTSFFAGASSSKFGRPQQGGKRGKSGKAGKFGFSSSQKAAHTHNADGTTSFTGGSSGKFGSSSSSSKKGTHIHNADGTTTFTGDSSASAAPPAPLAPPATVSCAGKTDKNTQLCPAYASHCQPGKTYTAWMLQNCDNTCCKAASRSASNCDALADQPAQAQLCSRYSSHCQEGQQFNPWMQLNCAKTCCTFASK